MLISKLTTKSKKIKKEGKKDTGKGAHNEKIK